MKIYLFLNDRILNFTISEEISGSFSFDEKQDEESKLINIEARNDKWVLYSTDDVSIINNGCTYNEIEIDNDGFYFLRRNNVDYLIYICSIQNNNFDIYEYDNNLNLTIGKNNECNLKYFFGNYSGIIATISFKDNNFILHKNENVNIYINNKILKEYQYVLRYGDIITIYSCKIIFLKDIILINNPLNKENLINAPGLSIKNVILNELQNNDVKDRNLYTKDNYFSKSPRIRRLIETKNIKISQPPSVDKETDLPLILTIGPMVTMALVSVVTVINSLSKIFSKSVSFVEQIPSLISAGAMLLSMLMWPLIMRSYNRKMKEKKKIQRINKYQMYLNTKKEEFENELKIQKEIIIENLISCDECIKIIQRKGYNFWDKRIDQDDFLLVRIGTGKTLLKANVEYSEEDFSLEEDELRKKADSLIDKYKYINDVPIGYSLFENRITAIMGNQEKAYAFVNNIILQLETFYSYEDLKFVIFTCDNKADYWDYMKYLNHNFSNRRDIRFFSSNIDSGKILSDYLLNELNFRKNNKIDFPKPHYIIITDNCELVKNYTFFKDFTETNDNFGFSYLILENFLSKLPSKCNNFITLGVDNQSGILKNSYEKQEQIYFNDEVNYNIDMMNIAKVISNIPIEFEDGVTYLPDTISFLEMEKIGKVEQLNILNRWNMNDSTTSLKAEIGVDENENLMYLDLHEKAHGPHGLIAGTTGSGKSEFIITYILSMCVNYSPDDVSFILIDYKGGGLALAFENQSTGVSLPHLSGIITNLDKAEMDRTLVSIDSEVKRRQKVFNEAREILGESTIDIYKYQRFYHEGKLSEPISHLFIICDEFAELKAQQPEFMDNLISIARIGRSLGVHLILATQKPTGVVNDQIWSNSRFKICLKVQDESDSREMLKKNDAAYLKQVGRFYLQVGYDEYYALGQSGWCGAKYYPSDKIIKSVDKSINIINDCGIIVKSIQASSSVKKNAQGDQLSAILNYIVETATKVNKHSRKLWLSNIPKVILIDELYKKYKINHDDSIKAIIGEYDAPEKQEQGLVEYDYLTCGNTIIYGNDGSEREMLLNSIIYSTVCHYSSDLVNFYAIDYGSEFLNKYLNLNHFGGVVTASENEEFNNLFKLIKRTINYRKKIFADMGCDFKLFNNNSDKKIPLIVIIINNYDSIYENNQNIYDELPDIVRDSERYGIVYLFSCSSVNSIHSKISTNCKNFYAFKLNDFTDYNTIFGINRKVTLRNYFGRGLISNDGLHEFQTAKVVLDDTKINSFMFNLISQLNQINPNKALKIPLLPEIVRFDDIKQYITTLNSVPIGISKEELSVIKYDFVNNIGNVISSNKLKNTENFVKSLLSVLRTINNFDIYIFDYMHFLNLDVNYFPNYFTSNFDEIINKLIDYIQNLLLNMANVEGVIVIYGLNKFVKNLQLNKLGELSDLLKKYEKISIIMLDDVSKIKSYSYDSWFTSIVNLSDGIWIGKGVSDQNLFHLSTVTKSLNVEIRNDMGYYISEGSVTLTKFIDFFLGDEGNGE